MSKNPNKRNVVEVGNPQLGGVEVVQAYKDPTRGTTQATLGYAVKDGALHVFKLDSEDGGWIDMGTIGGSSIILKWDVIENGFVTKAGTFETSDNVSYQLGRTMRNNPAAINDRVCIGEFYVESAGEYTITMLASKGSSYGIAHIIVDSVDLVQFDCYKSGAAAYNETFTSSLGTLTAGMKPIDVKMASKHASSSDYNFRAQIFIVRKA